MRRLIKRGLEKLGFELSRIQLEQEKFSPDYMSFNDIDRKVISKEFFEIYEECHQYTMTSIEKMYSLYEAVNYIIARGIEGDFIECGVWKGGSAMLIAHVLNRLGVQDRKIYLYDTYEGMSPPTEEDVHILSGLSASEILERDYGGNSSLWCHAGISETKSNMESTSFPMSKIEFIKGRVEDTIPETIPKNIALLRLDTDFYESTLHELEYLYPLLSPGGIVLFDDYGFWEGQKKAVDQYFKTNNIRQLLHRIDYSGRIAQKM